MHLITIDFTLPVSLDLPRLYLITVGTNLTTKSFVTEERNVKVERGCLYIGYAPSDSAKVNDSQNPLA